MLKFIGHGSAFNTKLGNTSAYIKHGKILFMIDCGSNTFDRLLKSNILDDVEHIYVLLTHTHPDHVGSLGDLIFYGYYAMGEVAVPKVTVLSPLNIEIHALLRLNGVDKVAYNLEQFSDSLEVSVERIGLKIEIESVKVAHVEELDCYGYIIKYEGKTTYYSGDSNDIPEYILRKLNLGDFDYFYQDTCRADYIGNVHLSLTKLGELIVPSKRDIIYCMHLDIGFDIEEAKKQGFNVVGE